MAEVHFAFTTAMNGIAPTYGGQPRGEAESGGGTTTLEAGNNEVIRAHAVSGASYVRRAPGTTAASASNGFYLAEGQTIDLHGAAGDQATQADA